MNGAPSVSGDAARSSRPADHGAPRRRGEPRRAGQVRGRGEPGQSRRDAGGALRPQDIATRDGGEYRRCDGFHRSA
jgi:hypothetical protein